MVMITKPSKAKELLQQYFKEPAGALFLNLLGAAVIALVRLFYVAFDVPMSADRSPCCHTPEV